MQCKSLIIWILIASCAAAEKGGVYKLRTSTGQGSCVAIETPADDHQHFLTIEHATKGGDLWAEVEGVRIPCEAVIRWPAKPEPIVMLRATQPVTSHVRTYSIAAAPVTRGASVYLVGFAEGEYLGASSEIVDVQPAYDSYYVTAGELQPGASGGAVLSSAGELVGIVQSVDPERKETLSTNVYAATQRFRDTQRVQWQCGPRGCFPVMPSYSRGVIKQSGKFKVIERGSAGILGRGYERYVESGPSSVTPAPPPVTVVPSVDYDRLAALVIERYGDQLKGEDGLPGLDGKDGESPQIDVSHLAEVIVDRYADRLRGPAGPQGPPGNTPTPSPRSQRVVLTEGGKIIDDETYHDGEPIVLDIRKLRITRD